eukprot:COSAG01_NODE_1789_length_9228_cov_4.869989_7_plen_181_part_00
MATPWISASTASHTCLWTTSAPSTTSRQWWRAGRLSRSCRGGHQFATIEEARAGLGEAFCEQPIYGPAGTAVLYDIGIFHTRMDGFDLQARKTIAEPERTVGRRTVHQYFSRGGWLGTSRRPAPPLTDWNIQPQRLADSPDREERIFFGHWNTAMADWAHAGYPALLKIPGPNRPFKSDS